MSGAARARARNILCFLSVGAGALAWAGPAAADTCANAAFRGGPGANLPDCRAWEQVSPASKNGNNLVTSGTTASGPDGDRVFYNGPGNLGGADSVPIIGSYAGNRGTQWSLTAIDPAIDQAPYLTNSPVSALSGDLGKALVVSTRKLTADAVEGNSNLYVRDTSDRSYALVVSAPGGALYRDFANFNGADAFLAASYDFAHITFSFTQVLAPGAVDGAQNIYQWDGGALKLVSIAPGGTPMAIGRAGTGTPARAQRTVSDDGSRVTFAATDDTTFVNSIYQRVNGTSTKLLARTHRTDPGDDPTAPVNADAPWASADGTQVTFTADGPLAENSPAGDGSPRLYRWNAAGDTLTDLLAGVVPDAQPIGSGTILETSPNGRYVWFSSNNPLTADAVDGVPNLYVLDTASPRRLTRVFSADDDSNYGFGVSFSPDGSGVAIRSASKPTGYDNANPSCVDTGTQAPIGLCAEIFSFDASNPTVPLACASCGAPGNRPDGNAEIGVLNAAFGGFRVSGVTDEGRVFFDTPEPLTGADVNSLSDVYEYTPGRGATLLTSGQGDQPATFADASPSGDDVFFYTADPLVAQDADTLTDLYDVRAGGGLAAQQVAPVTPVPCDASACQGPAPAATQRPTAGTATFVAPPRAPSFSVGSISSSARRAAARNGRLTLAVKVGAAGTVRARARARIGKRTATVAATSATARRAGTVRLGLRLSRSARRELARGHRLTLSISVSYSRAAKPAARTVTLTPPTSRSASRGGAR